MAKNPPNDKPVSPSDEREILDSFRESFQHDFPNPERIGCPGGEVLRALAWRRKLDNPETVVTHIGKCSPCFQEHRIFLQQYKSRQRLYRLAAVAVLTLGVTLWLSWRLMRGPGTLVPEPPPMVKTPSQPPPPVPSPVPPSAQEQKPAEVQVVLDLRKRGVARGENNNQDGGLDVPKGRLKLSIYLPIGSGEGDYEVRILGRQNQVLIAAKGKAQMQGHLNVLTVEANTSTFEAGSHSLAIREVGWGWNRFPLKVR